MGYTILEVSKKVNMSAYTLRYYEQVGILPSIERDNHGNRSYKDTDIEWINLLYCLRKTGMPISMIKHYVDLFLKGNETIQNRRQIMLDQKRNIEQKITELYQYLEVVNKKVAYYNILSDEEL
jgi:MerR family transcriptional regulator, aldehyde-responsive regulator